MDKFAKQGNATDRMEDEDEKSALHFSRRYRQNRARTPSIIAVFYLSFSSSPVFAHLLLETALAQ